MNSIKYFLALLMLVALANCSTTTAEIEKPKEKIPVENIVDVFKNIPFPKF
jgi:hypothetical protein